MVEVDRADLDGLVELGHGRLLLVGFVVSSAAS
jgi:hypothetical protein